MNQHTPMTWPVYGKDCVTKVSTVLKRGGTLSAYRSSSAFPDWVGPKSGSQCFLFERELEKHFSVKHAVGVNSGTMALTAALKALDLPKGSEVVTTSYSFSATPASILLAGYIPRFADISPYDFCLDVESVKKSITKKTKAILNVDLFGYLRDYKPLLELGLPVVQDYAQAVGAKRGEKALHGVIACGSGNGSKNLPGGELGFILTDSGKYADRMRHYISHGENFGDLEVGVNGRLQEIVATISRCGLQELEKRNQRRIDLVDIVSNYFKIPFSITNGSHVYYVHAFPVDNRKQFIKRMASHGIPVQAGYTQPLHTLPAFMKYQTKPLPVVEDVHKRLCLLTTLTPDKPLSYAKKVAGAIRESLD